MQREAEPGVIAADAAHRRGQAQVHPGRGHEPRQHRDDLFRGGIAEQLAEGFFVPGDPVAVDQLNEIVLGIAGEGGLGEMGILAQETLRRAVEVREIAAAPAGDADLLTRRFRVIDDQDAPARMGGTHHAGSPGSDDHRIELHGAALAPGGPRGQAGASGIRLRHAPQPRQEKP